MCRENKYITKYDLTINFPDKHTQLYEHGCHVKLIKSNIFFLLILGSWEQVSFYLLQNPIKREE